MATTQIRPEPEAKKEKLLAPKTVAAVKLVNMALVSYINENGEEITQLALIGDEKVQLLNNQDFNLGTVKTSKGPANDWLVRGIMEKLGRAKKK